MESLLYFPRPVKDPQWNQIKRLSDDPPHLPIETAHFLNVYKEMGKKRACPRKEDRPEIKPYLLKIL
jgi:inorganic pyrophosphatase